MNAAQRINLMITHYIEAVEAGKHTGYKIIPINHNNLESYYILLTPLKGVYKGHKYIIEMKTTYGCGELYTFPLQPPKMQFLSKILHVNINTAGTICLDIFKDYTKWSPMNSFDSVIQSIILLFETPNTSSPFNADASVLWSECDHRFKEQTTKKQIKAMSCNEEEYLFEQHFTPFITTATNIANTNDLRKYAKWFPELDSRKNIDNEVLLEENLKEYTLIYEQNKSKIDKKNNDTSNADKKPRWARHQK